MYFWNKTKALYTTSGISKVVISHANYFLIIFTFHQKSVSISTFFLLANVTSYNKT